MTWKHSPVFVVKKGRILVNCACGVNSGWLNDMAEASAWYGRHTGVVEKRPKKGA